METNDSTYACLAVDLGASSGRVMAAEFDGRRLSLREVHRFPNGGVRRDGTLFWDFDALWREVREGIRLGIASQKAAGCPARSIGVDTWGVDFGLIGGDGALLAPPVHYRDERTEGVMRSVFENTATGDDIFAETGIQFLPFNTIYQLAALKRQQPDMLAAARHLLMMPDILHYLMTGRIACELTDASTTQLINPATGDWSDMLIGRLGLPRLLFPKIIHPGTRLGRLLPDVARDLGSGEIEVIAVATHDTGSAVAAVPAEGSDFAYLSCGTWSLLGAEVPTPVITDESRRLNFTNEGGVGGTFRLLKNIAGLWLLQESKTEWARQGNRYEWAEITALADEAPAFRSFIDPDDDRFLAPGDIPDRIRSLCADTGQEVPATDGAVARCVLESLALKYRRVLEMLDSLVGRRLGRLHMVGGGIRNTLLCQWTADACGREVVAGPVEATAQGNAAVQLIAAGRIPDLTAARRVICEADKPATHEPDGTDIWDQAFARFERLFPQ